VVGLETTHKKVASHFFTTKFKTSFIQLLFQLN
jgi:hypothetical protein